MAINELQKQTNVNIQEKANLIWEIATHLVGLYKPHEYGKVILPMTVLKRFDDALASTKQKVLDTYNKLCDMNADGEIFDGALCNASGYTFYNYSKFDFARLLADPQNIAENFEDYIKGFSDNIKDILTNFNFDDELKKMVNGNVLYVVIQEFNSKKADMSPDKITSTDMGYVFEELIRKFSESYNEEAGAHFTSRDIIYLMTELLISPEKDEIVENGCYKTAYDMTMGTSQMLGCLTERVKEINPDSELTCFGQEFNPETYAIAKADMLIKGGNASGMKYGDTLSEDAYYGYEFDYIISNPPFGIDWKREKDAVDKEAKLGYDGRFGPGLPQISDGQLLFMLNGVKKLKEGSGRMAIIQNGSSLFTGDAGSGPSEIRKYLIEQDLVEAIIQLPTDLFYNTGIATYIWVISKDKAEHRLGKVQLIDASKCFVKRRKNIGNKRVDLDDNCIEMIVQAYNECKDELYENGNLAVESKVFDNAFFGYTKVTVETALTDENGKQILKKGKPQPTKGKTDSEIIPLTEDVGEYFNKNVLPYNPLTFMDRTKDKIGYEIPFTRLFYKFVAPRSSDEIFAEFKTLSIEEEKLMKEILE
ncbi:MAG: SAM-dependent DNA methyltransferase [Clostridia bacterium]|nr:SAM-dependent DNA methyltransferase [Clostridia bacterium]